MQLLDRPAIASTCNSGRNYLNERELHISCLYIFYLVMFFTFLNIVLDGVPAHRARETVALLTNETSDFINPTL